MFNVEFMTGAVLLSTLHVTLVLAVLYVLFRIGQKVYRHLGADQPLNIKWELAFMAVFLIFTLLVGGAGQPKITIDVPKSRELIEYENDRRDITIVPSEPRTKDLEGFTPLKQGD